MSLVLFFVDQKEQKIAFPCPRFCSDLHQVRFEAIIRVYSKIDSHKIDTLAFIQYSFTQQTSFSLVLDFEGVEI